ncbi:hypothetical protein ACFPVT_03180 [Corynebacterium choanae]|uniref:Secreted protein n=1 Tax=Corynebacterium choanae TaxID=1862358 RepID=A0A3G6J9I2_9CORY|nr:hypothetical protein [Corynebacterium choanae]AZA14727.1 hypothetical protein CCHOA_11780 [Corynebacterium choanae]
MTNTRLRWRRLLGCCAATALLSWSSPAAATPAVLPFPQTETNLPAAEQWLNNTLRPVETTSDIRLHIEQITTLESPKTDDRGVLEQPLGLTVTIENHSSQPVSDLTVRLQHAGEVTTAAAGLSALGQDHNSYGWATDFVDIPGTIKPGDRRTFLLHTTTQVATETPAASTATPTGRATQSGNPTPSEPLTNTAQRSDKLTTTPLSFPNPGTYPLLINLNGRIGDEAIRYLDSDRWLTIVGTPPAQTPRQVGVMWPLTGDTGLLPGATGQAPDTAPLYLVDDHLATELAEGGRIWTWLQTFTAAISGPGGEQLQQSTCLAIDPALLDVIDRMRGEYFIAQQRPSPVAPSPQLRDLFHSTSKQLPPTTPGSGQDAATAFIAALSDVAQHTCVVALPYGNADINAISAIGDLDLLRLATAGGAARIESILHVPVAPLTTSPTGWIAPNTAKTFGFLEQFAAASTTWPALRSATSNTPEGLLVASGEQEVEGVSTITYDAALAQLLAAVNTQPLSLATTQPDGRFDPTFDSPTARRITAAAAVATAVTADPSTPLVVLPPAEIDDPAAQPLRTIAELFATGAALPASPATLLQQTRAQQPPNPIDWAATTPTNSDNHGATTAGDSIDVTAPTELEIRRAAQQATYTIDLARLMVRDPKIALTPEGFISPLLSDLFLALTMNGRQNPVTYQQAVAAADWRLTENRAMVQRLRASVTLLPPGAVYTRISDESPLLIVGRNGLPLPARATIGWQAPPGTVLDVPASTIIPAKGSLTIQFTATVPQQQTTTRRGAISMWLANVDGVAISDPVKITVETRAGITGYAPSTLLLVLIATVFGYRLVRFFRRKHNDGTLLKHQP